MMEIMAKLIEENAGHNKHDGRIVTEVEIANPNKKRNGIAKSN